MDSITWQDIAIVIPTVQPQRRDSLKDLLNQLEEIKSTVCIQTQNAENTWQENQILALEKFSKNKDIKWVLFLEDDIVLCPNFHAIALDYLNTADRRSATLLSLYSTDTKFISTEKILRYKLFSTVGMFISIKVLADLCDFLREYWKRPHKYGNGYAISMFYTINHIRSYRTMPSLIQHRVDIDSIITPKKRKRYSKSFEEFFQNTIHPPKPLTHLTEDRGLRLAKWADCFNDQLIIDNAQRALKMANSDATGEPLLSNGSLGADIIRFAAGEGVKTHTHEGDHILLALYGRGRIIWNGIPYEVKAGEAYLVEGKMPHSIEAETDFVLMAIGNKHYPVNSQERMSLV